MVKTITKLLNFFRRKTTKDDRPLITDEQLAALVTDAIKRVVIRAASIPRNRWELLNRKNEAMILFVKDNPYRLNRKSLVKARKIIKKSQSHFRSATWVD